MKSTPPRARVNAAAVLGPVWPTYSPTRSLRSTSTRWPTRNMSSALSRRPYSRATVVLPVPGLPANTRCRVSGGAGSPASWRRRTVCISLTSEPTSRLARSSPTSRSSSPSRSSRFSSAGSVTTGAGTTAGRGSGAGPGGSGVGLPPKPHSSNTGAAPSSPPTASAQSRVPHRRNSGSAPEPMCRVGKPERTTSHDS